MHGVHSFPGAPASLVVRAADGRRCPLADAVTADARAHSLFHTLDPAHRFRAGGLIGRDGTVDREALHRLMALLAQRIGEASAAPEAKLENTGLPSGYTYLMQFIAHDMVDSVVSVRREAGALRPSGLNARAAALMLDTLYGAGPEETSNVYAVTEGTLRGKGDIPRLQLRIGEPQAPGASAATLYCPYRDLARAKAPSSDKLAGPSANLLTEAYVADMRNDSHAFMSQITVLFVLLHNQVLSLLAAVPASDAPIEDAYRRFLCARIVVTMIYRNIILEDLLPRIVDAAVLARYRSDNNVFFDGEKTVPIEFTHGAFRFGHAIVREKYRVRDDKELETPFALDFAATRMPAKLPVPEKWFVDWARFFDTAKPADPAFRRNYSMRIGPHYGNALRDANAFPAKSPIDADGLASRDLVSASYAGLLSVPALSAKMQSIFGARVVRPFEQWREPLRQWLTRGGSTGVQFTNGGRGSAGRGPAAAVLRAVRGAGGGGRQDARSDRLHHPGRDDLWRAAQGHPRVRERRGDAESPHRRVRRHPLSRSRASCPRGGRLDCRDRGHAGTAGAPGWRRPAPEPDARLNRCAGGFVVHRTAVRRVTCSRTSRSVRRPRSTGVASSRPGRPANPIFQRCRSTSCPVPRTLDDLKAQCALVGVEITIPAKFTGFAVIQHGPETLALRLPAKAMVKAAEADLEQGLDLRDTAFLRGLLRPAQRASGQAQGLPGLPHRRLLDRHLRLAGRDWLVTRHDVPAPRRSAGLSQPIAQAPPVLVASDRETVQEPARHGFWSPAASRRPTLAHRLRKSSILRLAGLAGGDQMDKRRSLASRRCAA